MRKATILTETGSAAFSRASVRGGLLSLPILLALLSATFVYRACWGDCGGDGCSFPCPAKFACTGASDCAECVYLVNTCHICIPSYCVCIPEHDDWICRGDCALMCLPRSIDDDADTDLADFAIFQRCFTGQRGGAGVPEECLNADQDGNGDVDLRNYCVFLLTLTGPQ